jgi:hypothetical protein
VPEVRRKSSPALSSAPRMSLKPFNRHRFSSASVVSIAVLARVCAP